jgi:HK97 family phage portal protein
MNRLTRIITTIMQTKESYDSAFMHNREFNFSGNSISSPYKQSDMVYICVSTTARAIAQVPLLVFQKTDDGKYYPDYGNPFNKILRRPNFRTDAYSFIEQILTRLLVDGNVCIIGYPPGVNQDLYVVPFNAMEPIKNKKTGQLEGWIYKSSAGKFEFGIEEVCHIWFFNPDDPIVGLSPLEAGSMPVNTDYRAAKYNQIFFEKGASLAGVFYTDAKLNPKQIERLELMLKQKASRGVETAHQNLLLESGLKYQKIAVNQKDMEFLQGRRFNAERIMQIYGMKKSIISDVLDVNKATAKAELKSWWENTNLPLMRLVSSALTLTYIGFNEEKVIAFDTTQVEALREGIEEKVDIAHKLVQIGFTPNEVNERLELGFKFADWRNTALRAQQFVPFKILPPGTDPDVGDYDTGDDIPEERAIKIDKTSFIFKTIYDISKPIEKKFEERVNVFFFEMRKAILKWLYDQQKNVSGEFKDGAPFILTEPLSTLDKLAVKPLGKLKREADKLYEESLREGLRTIALEVGIGIDIDILVLPEAMKYLIAKQLKIKGISKTINRQVGKRIAEGIDKLNNIDQIAESIKEVFGFAKTRAEKIANTEVFGSVNKGRNLTIIEAGFKKVVWKTVSDNRVRDTHVPMHNQMKKVKDFWVLPSGAKLQYPCDYAGPPEEVINCRCIEIVDITSL